MFSENRLIDPNARWSFGNPSKQAVATVIQARTDHPLFLSTPIGVHVQDTLKTLNED